MAEIFEPTPEPDNSKQPKVLSPEAKICRTISALLMIIWFWWWWNSYDDGAYWVILAVFILATGETRPHYYKFFQINVMDIGIARGIDGLEKLYLNTY